MIDKIDVTSNRVRTPVTSPLLPAQPRSTAVSQVIPARSALTIAKNALENDMLAADNVLSELDMLSDTTISPAFPIGVMSGDRGMNSFGSSGKSRPRNMLRRLANQVASVAPEQLEELRGRISAIEQVEEVDDLLDSLRRHLFDSGEIALLLATMLNEHDLSPAKRRCLELSLDKAMDDEDWTLQLFGYLEFGTVGRHGLAELRRLYQQATSQNSEVLYWFSQFRQLNQRQKKLKSLIRALAFELSSEFGVSNVHLASVITDLKKILQFLTLEDHSKRVAKALKIPVEEGDLIIEELLVVVQQSWIYPDWLSERASKLLPEGHCQYGYVRHMVDLIKLMPEACFNDIEQREIILQAFAEYQEELVNSE